MTEERHGNRLAMGGGAAVVLVVLVPLWGEFHETGHVVWNVILGLMLVGIAIVTFFLQRYLQKHSGEIGEARFDTANKNQDG